MFALTRNTANTKWPNASLSNRCCVTGGEKRWVDWTGLPYSGQPLCANRWGHLPVLLRRAAWFWLGRRCHRWCGQCRGWHCRGGRYRRFAWKKRSIQLLSKTTKLGMSNNKNQNKTTWSGSTPRMRRKVLSAERGGTHCMSMQIHRIAGDSGVIAGQSYTGQENFRVRIL